MPETKADFAKLSELLKPDEVAVQLRCSHRYVTLLVQRGKIAHIKFGRNIRFRPEHVEAFLNKHSERVFQQPEKKPLDVLALRMGR